MLKSIKELKFIKRDGSIQDYDRDKMLNFLVKIGIESKDAEILIDDFFEDVGNVVRAEVVVQALERVCARRISPATPQFEQYAGILYLQSVKMQDYGKVYPDLMFLKSAKNIDPRYFDRFTESELTELSNYMKPERDNKFNYKSIFIFHQKYCKELEDVISPVTGSVTKIRELPQLAYMRVAIFLTGHLPDHERLWACKRVYDSLSLHKFTVATPIIVNACTYKPQTSSCVLMTVGDCTDSLLDINTKIGVMSKNIAGIAVNIENLRARGSKIVQGVTSGPIPFLKVFEATVSAWNQGGARPGALCVYFQWWHKDVMDLLSLRSNGGTDENRARRLKYSCKVNKLFIDKVLNNEDIVLLNPFEAPDLHGVYGEEFNKRYEKYLQDPNIPKIPAREVWRKLFKERSETGNIYLFHEENVNEVGLIGRYVGSSNLCTEVVLPSKPSMNFIRYRSDF